MLPLLFVVFLSSIVSSLAEDTNANIENVALQYTTDTFSSSVAANNHFVLFHAPWCGHCNRLAPVWEELAEKNNKEGSEVTIAKVDCTVETALCSDQDVTGYPTLKFFQLGVEEGVKYRGSRELEALTNYIDERLGKPKVDPVELPIPTSVNGLYELSEDTFAKHIATGKHFVKFFAPWCGHCQKLAPVWDELAKSLEHSTSVTIAKVDCTVHRPICAEMDIKGYPTLLWIEDGKKVDKYQGQRTHEDMKAFISRMIGPADAGTAEEQVEEKGPIVVLNGDTFEHGIATGLSFIKYFAPWCGHCKRLAPTWEELGKKFIANPSVKIVKVDCTLESSKDLCNQQEVDGFPTLLLYQDGEKLAEYNGSRTLDDLYEFVMDHMPHDEL